MSLASLNSFLSKRMPILVLLVSALALLFPSGFTWVAPRITILLGMVMFGMGTMLRLADFQLIFQRPRDVLLGCLAQYALMPLIAFVLVRIFALPTDIALGVLLVGCCPGGTASNVITYLAKGDIALSVTITMITTLLSPIITPLLMLCLTGETIAVPFFSMMFSICQVVLFPILMGIIVNTFLQRLIQKITVCLPTFSIIVISLIIGGVMAVNADKIVSIGIVIAVVVVLHNLTGFALGYLVSRMAKLERPKVKAITIEVGMQNSGLAASLAMIYFGAAAAIPGALFSVWHNLSGSLIANYFAKQD